jgi:hypothetical protein
MFMKKIKKSAVGPVVIVMLFVGENRIISSGISVKDVVFF